MALLPRYLTRLNLLPADVSPHENWIFSGAPDPLKDQLQQLTTCTPTARPSLPTEPILTANSTPMRPTAGQKQMPLAAWPPRAAPPAPGSKGTNLTQICPTEPLRSPVVLPTSCQASLF